MKRDQNQMNFMVNQLLDQLRLPNKFKKKKKINLFLVTFLMLSWLLTFQLTDLYVLIHLLYSRLLSVKSEAIRFLPAVNSAFHSALTSVYIYRHFYLLFLRLFHCFFHHNARTLARTTHSPGYSLGYSSIFFCRFLFIFSWIFWKSW